MDTKYVSVEDKDIIPVTSMFIDTFFKVNSDLPDIDLSVIDSNNYNDSSVVEKSKQIYPVLRDLIVELKDKVKIILKTGSLEECGNIGHEIYKDKNTGKEYTMKEIIIDYLMWAFTNKSSNNINWNVEL